jgi:hypothetical protein
MAGLNKAADEITEADRKPTAAAKITFPSRTDDRIVQSVLAQRTAVKGAVPWLLALARLEPPMRLVDHVDAALAADDAVIAVARAEGLYRVSDLHGTFR